MSGSRGRYYALVRALVVWGLCAVVAGCSDDDPPSPNPPFPADQTCGLRAEITGDLTASLSGKAGEVDCSTGLPGLGLRPAFLPAEGELMSFELRVNDVTKGATGNNFAATVLLESRAETYREHFGAVDLTEHQFLGPGQHAGQPYGEQYRVVGSGRCTPAAGSESVTVGPFEFVTLLGWRTED